MAFRSCIWISSLKKFSKVNILKGSYIAASFEFKQIGDLNYCLLSKIFLFVNRRRYAICSQSVP